MYVFIMKRAVPRDLLVTEEEEWSGAAAAYCGNSVSTARTVDETCYRWLDSGLCTK